MTGLNQPKRNADSVSQYNKDISKSANKVLYKMPYIFQIWIEIQINIRYVHLTSPQINNIGVDVIYVTSFSRSLSLPLALDLTLSLMFTTFFFVLFTQNVDRSSLSIHERHKTEHKKCESG